MKTILLVEDDYLNIEKIRLELRLQNHDHVLFVANNGAEALEMLIREENKISPDIILLDIDMPKMGGLEFLQIVKSYYSLRSIKIFMIVDPKEESAKFAPDIPDVIGVINKPLDFSDANSDGIRLLKTELAS